VYLWRPRDERDLPPDALSYFGTLSNDTAHGGAFNYRSILTDVLGWVLERAAGTRLAELIAREVWQPMGAEHDAEITVDAFGNPMADGGISATLRDMARFGQLMLDRGRQRIVPASWVADTIRGARDGAEAFVRGGPPPGWPTGGHYRNCWWVREPSVPFFHASGINGQAVFIHVPAELVVVKFSTWPTALSPSLLRITLGGVWALAQELAGKA
jgi:CubicO group peptidase (beta-lactamase class C family)